MTGCFLSTAWINIIPGVQPLSYKLKERRDSFSRCAKVKASKLSFISKKEKKKKNTSKHSRHLNNTHRITLDCLPNINKENAWDLSASVSQLSWSTKSGDGMEWDMYCCHCAWPVSNSQPLATVGWNSQLPSLVQASSASARLPSSLRRQ